MSLRALHTFIFASEARMAHYTCTQRGALCQYRRYYSLSGFSTLSACAGRGRFSSLTTCLPQPKGWEERRAHLCETARNNVNLLSRGRQRERTRRRGFHSSAARPHEAIVRPEPGTGIKIHFQDSKGQPLKTIEANEGDNILDLAHEYDIDLEGACEGSVACSTCHVILMPEHYDMLPDPEDDENDMLDMAFGLTDTSRLGCQVKVTPDLNGMVVKLPSATRNMFVDGVKPTKH